MSWMRCERSPRSEGIEVSSSSDRVPVGTPALWPTTAGRIVAPKVRGADQLVQAVEDVRRSCEHGIESVLVTDEGLLEVLGELKRAGAATQSHSQRLDHAGSRQPSFGAEPGTARSDHLQRRRISAWLSLPRCAPRRRCRSISTSRSPTTSAVIRHYEIAEIVRVTAPVYLKFGLRNAPNIYPSGTHLEATAVSLTRERLRRAKLGLDLLHRLDPDTIMSPLPQPAVARA